MKASSSEGCLPEADKYLFFSDNTTKERTAFHAARGKRSGGPSAPQLEPSGFAPTGWDKYFFYSIAQTDTVGGIHTTARKGRERPPMQGPQTFQLKAFSNEDFARAQEQRQTGTKTSYTEFFSQLPRSKTHIHGPIEEREGVPHGFTYGETGSSMIQRASSESVLQKSASQTLAGSGTIRRPGPHWPPAPGADRPDPYKTRTELFQGSHRTIVDHHARDRQAPRAWQYTITTV